MLSLSDISGSMVTLESGKELFIQDDYAGYFYVVLSGTVDIYHDKEIVMRLGPESVLGAEPLFSRESRYLYTVKSSGTVRFSRYSYLELLDMLGAQPRIVGQILNSICHQLKQLWTGAGLRAGIAAAQHFSGDIRSYKSDEWVIREGEDDTQIFRIVSAEKGLEVSRGGHKLAILQNPGEFFGEMAAILNEKRTASVKSLGNSILEVYPGDHLQKIFADYPQVSMRIISALSQRLAETTKALTESMGRG